MLNVKPANLNEMLRADRAVRDLHMEQFERMREEYTGGPSYRADFTRIQRENHVYEYLSLGVPRMVYNNPRVSVSTSRGGIIKKVARAFQFGMNRWCRDTNVRRTLVQQAYDMHFSYCVAIVGSEARPGMDRTDPSVPHWPVMYRLSPRRFVADSLASNPRECRYMAHAIVEDKDDLLARAREPGSDWNPDVIDSLGEDAATDQLGRDEKAEADAPERREVVYYELWVPEYTELGWPGPDEGFHGAIFTISPEKDEYLRPPRPYYGPRTGPYELGGVYTVPDLFYPLSPLVAVDQQVQELNAHADSAALSMKQYKRMVLYDATHPELAQALQKPGNFLIPVQGFEKNEVVQIEIAGVTDQQLQAIAMLRARLDRVSGMQEAARGLVSGKGTATENAIAEESASTRMAFIRQQFEDFTAGALYKVAWFMYHDDRIQSALGEEGEAELGVPFFTGGLHQRGSGATFDDLQLEIEPYSMQRMTEQNRLVKAGMVTDTAIKIGTAAMQLPHVDWQEILKINGDALQEPTMDEIVDIQKAKAMGMMQMMGGMGLGQPPEMPSLGGSSVQPRLSGETGTFGPRTINAGAGANLPTGAGTMQKPSPAQPQKAEMVGGMR